MIWRLFSTFSTPTVRKERWKVCTSAQIHFRKKRKAPILSALSSVILFLYSVGSVHQCCVHAAVLLLGGVHAGIGVVDQRIAHRRIQLYILGRLHQQGRVHQQAA